MAKNIRKGGESLPLARTSLLATPSSGGHPRNAPVDSPIEAPYELPEGWKWCRLGDIADCLDGFRKPINATERATREGCIPYYGATGQVGWIDDFLTDEELVLLGEDGAPFLDLLKYKAYIISGKAWVNNHAHILRSKYGEEGNKYLLNYLNSFNYTGYVNGTTRLKLTQGEMLKIPFPLPPTLAEQQRIVNRIETMFAKLDQAQEKAQSVLDSFEPRKAAILNKAFTGKLTANWRKENGVLDDSWEEKRLEDVCDFITKGTTPKKEDMSIGNGDIPYIKVYNLCFDTKLDFTIDPTFVKLESHKNFLARSITLPGDVLMNIVGPPFGKVSIVPDSYPEWNINQAIARFRCKSELYNVYLANYLISPKTIENMSRQIKTTAGQQNLTLEICRNMTILVPSLPEQQEIVSILDTVLEKETRAKEAAQTVLNQIALLKKSILARAFRGEL